MSFDSLIASVGIDPTADQARACRLLETTFGLRFCVDFGTDNALDILRDKVASHPRTIRERSFESLGFWWFAADEWGDLCGPYDSEELAEYHRHNELDRMLWGCEP